MATKAITATTGIKVTREITVTRTTKSATRISPHDHQTGAVSI